MPTTIHIPKPLLEKVDARAKALRMSRNRLIVLALEEKLTPPRQWPEDVLRILQAPVDRPMAEQIDRMLESIHAGRRSRKRPVKL